MSAVEAARAVLAAASLVDSTMPKPDVNVLRMWAEILGDIDVDAAKRAIIAHYGEEHRRIMPADVRRRVEAERAVVTAQRVVDGSNCNAVPDADPDDVPAWLAALRAGRLVDRSPKGLVARPVSALVASTLARRPINERRRGPCTGGCDCHWDGPAQSNGMAACCDPNDCGPCCEKCPTCPSVQRWAAESDSSAQPESRTA